MSNVAQTRRNGRIIRHRRVRKKVHGTAARPRLAVYRSTKHLTLQVIDDDAGRTIVASNLETANLIEGYHVIAEWIRFADAKAAVVLTVGGAIAGLVIPTLKGYLTENPTTHPTAWWNSLVSTLFAVWLLLLLKRQQRLTTHFLFTVNLV